MSDKKPVLALDGHVPFAKGWIPAVQGGYKPATNHLAAPPPPPTGGSGVKPPKNG